MICLKELTSCEKYHIQMYPKYKKRFGSSSLHFLFFLVLKITTVPENYH